MLLSYRSSSIERKKHWGKSYEEEPSIYQLKVTVPAELLQYPTDPQQATEQLPMQ